MITPTAAQPLPDDTRASRVGLVPRGFAALAGVVAAAVALATGELFAALVSGAPSPVAAVGAALIDFAPPGAKEIVVALFGTNDKPAILVLITGTVLLIGAGIGLLGRTRPSAAIVGIIALVGVGFVASVRQTEAQLAMALLSAALQAGLGIQVLTLLLAAAPREAPGGPSAPSPASPRAPGRRGFLVRAGVIGGLAVVAGGIGRTLLEGRAAQVASVNGTIPQAVEPAIAPGPDASFAVDGITPLVVPNADFYRIDTALVTPSVNLGEWRLKVHGMVRNELSLTFDELVQLPLIERYVTIACVSNEVGGGLVGNAKWTGVRLTDVLAMAEPFAEATQIVPRSVDGWTAGFPTEWVTAPDRPRDALIAVKMNDEPLPAAHGFPARLIVPGLYGYVSATKWLSDIELTTLEAFDAYWVPRGWSKEAPILTQSRIDVPGNGGNVREGPVAVAGVAWAPDRGISAVEVSVDGGAWQRATIATPIGPQTWVQWKWTWQATPGEHELAVRAIDGTGEVQTDQVTRPDPDGARGHHRIAVRVG